MTYSEHIDYWLKSAEEDLHSAWIMHQNKRFTWSLFIGHLVLEKILKAHYICHTHEKVPPKTHNLLKLSELSNITLTDEQSEFLFIVNDFQISGRYPDYKSEILKIATE